MVLRWKLLERGMKCEAIWRLGEGRGSLRNSLLENTSSTLHRPPPPPAQIPGPSWALSHSRTDGPRVGGRGEEDEKRRSISQGSPGDALDPALPPRAYQYTSTSRAQPTDAST